MTCPGNLGTKYTEGCSSKRKENKSSSTAKLSGIHCFTCPRTRHNHHESYGRFIVVILVLCHIHIDNSRNNKNAYVTPTHKGELEVISIKTINMGNSTHSMQAMTNLPRLHIKQAITTLVIMS
jgi:hypothetical protein